MDTQRTSGRTNTQGGSAPAASRAPTVPPPIPAAARARGSSPQVTSDVDAPSPAALSAPSSPGPTMSPVTYSGFPSSEPTLPGSEPTHVGTGTNPGTHVLAVSGNTDQIPQFDAQELFGDGEGERTVVQAVPFDLRARFTGRRGPIDTLLAMFAKTGSTRTASLAALIGEPGMGKSRLLGELISRAKAEAPGLLVIGGAADEVATPYGPMARALSARFGFVAGEPEAESRDRIQAAVAEVLPATRVPEVAHLLAYMLRVPFEQSPVVGPLVESPQRLESRTFMAVRRYLAALAEHSPLLIFVENLEACGQETINLVQYLVAGMASLPVMAVVTATAALFEKAPGFGEGDVPLQRLDLGALSPDESEAILRELLRPLDVIPPELIIHARTVGATPRFLHETVRLLLESESVVRGGGALWRIDAVRLAATKLPTTYEQLVAARLAVMDAAERSVLEMAAAIGEASWLDAIVALDRVRTTITRDPDGPTLSQIAASGDHSRLAVAAAVGRLIEREWLLDMPTSTIPGERELRFAYPNLWSIVDQATDPDTRRRYHGTTARWLELRPDARGASAPAEVARHFELAGELREAALRYRRAADTARAQYQNERAIRLFDRALACIGDSDTATRILLWHDVGSVYEMIGDFEAALGAFERVLRLSWLVASKTKAAVAFNKMGRVWRRRGDLRLALEYLERGLELFRTADDTRGIAGSLDDIGRVLHLLGRYDEAFQKITEALARRGKAGDKRSIASSLSTLGMVQQDRGQYEAAFTCHQEALELRLASQDRWGIVVSRNHLAALQFEAGELADARTGWATALAEAESIGASPLAAMALTNLGELGLREGKVEEARSRLEDALEIIEDIEAPQLETDCCRQLALCDLAAQDAVSAREMAERALKVATKAGIREKEALAHLTLGQVVTASLYDAGDTVVGGAEHHFQLATEILRAIGNDTELAKGLEAYARYLIEHGDSKRGKTLLHEALVVFTRLGLGARGQAVGQLLSAID